MFSQITLNLIDLCVLWAALRSTLGVFSLLRVSSLSRIYRTNNPLSPSPVTDLPKTEDQYRWVFRSTCQDTITIEPMR